MKKILLIGSFIILSLTTLGATVMLPKDTAEVISCDYSSGGGDKAIVYLEVLVKDNKGNYHMYTDTKTSLSGLIGFGRFTIPKKFDFIISKTLKGEIKVKF